MEDQTVTEPEQRCPVCDRKMFSDGQRTLGFCSGRCEDRARQEQNSKKKLPDEVEKLMEQYEKQRKDG
jgi:tRNA(Ile2) C34 agmatinyltransferase TiaS